MPSGGHGDGSGSVTTRTEDSGEVLAEGHMGSDGRMSPVPELSLRLPWMSTEGGRGQRSPAPHESRPVLSVTVSLKKKL